MPKHVIEDDYSERASFKKVRVGENIIAGANTEYELEIIGDGTLDIDIRENKLRLASRVPKFTTRDF